MWFGWQIIPWFYNSIAEEMFIYAVTMLFILNRSAEFYQIYNFGALGDKRGLVIF